MELLPMTEGVLRYDPGSGEWKRVSSLRRSELPEGYNMVYFRNLMCPSCLLLDLKFPDLVATYACTTTVTVVTCMWFTRLCLSRPARAAFVDFSVKESPTLYLARVVRGRAEKEAYIIGALSLAEYRSYIHRSLGMRPCPRSPLSRL
ncbi:MAG: hypothetical protein ACP5HK_03325 [Acidilobus sp.]